MQQYDHAQVKFNNGTGALLCNGCSVVLKYGFDYKDSEHYCTKCNDLLKSAMQYKTVTPDLQE